MDFSRSSRLLMLFLLLLLLVFEKHLLCCFAFPPVQGEQAETKGVPRILSGSESGL